MSKQVLVAEVPFRPESIGGTRVAKVHTAQDKQGRAGKSQLPRVEENLFSAELRSPDPSLTPDDRSVSQLNDLRETRFHVIVMKVPKEIELTNQSLPPVFGQGVRGDPGETKPPESAEAVMYP